jgi:hypothetical protein
MVFSRAAHQPLERRLQPVMIFLEISLRFPIVVFCGCRGHRRSMFAVPRQAGRPMAFCERGQV